MGLGTARSLNRPGQGTAIPEAAQTQIGIIWSVVTLTLLSLSLQKINRTPSDEECFFDLLSKFQSNRMDDQRCPLEECPAEAAEAAATRVPALAERICEHCCLPKSPFLWE